MRKITVTLDGESVTFAPMTFGQLREFTAGCVDINKHEQDSPERTAELFAFNCKIVCEAVNRANPDAKLTQERIENEWDAKFLNFVSDKVLVESGVELKAQPVGETQAATAAKASVESPQQSSPRQAGATKRSKAQSGSTL
jgi:hypothetical protein